jgi:hypothetical protein
MSLVHGLLGSSASQSGEAEPITGWHFMQTPLAPLTADSSSQVMQINDSSAEDWDGYFAIKFLFGMNTVSTSSYPPQIILNVGTGVGGGIEDSGSHGSSGKYHAMYEKHSADSKSWGVRGFGNSWPYNLSIYPSHSRSGFSARSTAHGDLTFWNIQDGDGASSNLFKTWTLSMCALDYDGSNMAGGAEQFSTSGTCEFTTGLNNIYLRSGSNLKAGSYCYAYGLKDDR